MRFFYATALLLAPSMAVAVPTAEGVNLLVERQMAPCLAPELQNPWNGNSAKWGKLSTTGFATAGLNTANCVDIVDNFDVTTVGALYNSFRTNVWAASVPDLGAKCGTCIAPLKANGARLDNVRLFIVNAALFTTKEVASGAITAMNGLAPGCWTQVALSECLKMGCST
ncbi:hypothetical protein TWF696_007437 [Orbilia brochopaga]|uniref:Uncharacterized protein n=1 Tax=Orbilia brochopaga TaxID=3140254 RepID=A0AAV9USC2_9PEZI